MLRNLLSGYPLWAAVPMAMSVAFALAYVVSDVVCRALSVPLSRLGNGSGRTHRSGSPSPLGVLRLTLFVATTIVLVSPALKVAGIDLRVGYEPEAVVSWLLASGVRIGLIVLLTVLVVRATSAAITRIEDDIGQSAAPDALERARRVRTLGTLVENAVGTIAIGTALLMVLRELSIDILPLLTGAGIVGLAIGFGAQTLVKDVISGFFMILENQVRVGDVVAINGVSGVVESMKLRTVTLRDVEGTVHVFPNGSVGMLANKTKDFSYALLDLHVGYREDTDRVMALLETVGETLRRDPALGPSILEPMEVLGIEAFGDSAVTLRMRFKTLPLKQWDVARELRRRVRARLVEEGVELPAPQRGMVVAERSR